MKKQIITLLIFLFVSVKAVACSCDTPKPILEFYSSKYVFEGLVTFKKIAKDSATYSIKVKVLKNYKKGNIPKELHFTLYYEKESSGGSSCHMEVHKNQKLLVFASEYKGKLGFSIMCSNSQVIQESGINPLLQKVLDHGNEFKLDNYIYDLDNTVNGEFNSAKPITNLDSIFKNAKAIKSDKPLGLFALYINKKGELVSVFNFFDWYKSSEDFIIDPAFGLMKEFKVKSRRPLTEFEIYTIELLKNLKIWELKKYKNSQIAVDYMAYISVDFDEKTLKWTYELK
ncbi:hypothetical protein [Flavobacterium nitrogenifigens]|uniref:Tissue inhibitor of metalloproteinase n=1 Tax=Flavobacterium nitrogenifigens TaxID=1617283 RepID=A0A521DNG3_9FLAO|nr:hypothetical protein [Flavobacterium nitrogenifigens]KAF2329939.1 hypothetical protein DM397_14465 [Flavobacterium nitrogenifigens]SMO73223.1 hypothetical protein SAMN06265220_103234 [Flavobacterium nitrogenifigens]